MELEGAPAGDTGAADLPIPPEIVANLPAPIQEALKEPTTRAELLSFTAAFAGWSGPYPPPNLLQGYEDVLPGSADRLIKMAEKQQDHRHYLEKIAIEGGSRRAWWGLWLGFVISLVVLGLGTLTILQGYEWVGGTVMGADVVALAGVFVYGQRQQSKERVDKDAQSHQPSQTSSKQKRPEVTGGSAD